MKKLQPLSVVFAMLLLAGIQNSHAQVVPYFSFGTNAVYSPFTTVYEADGIGFPVGFHHNIGKAVTSPTADPLVLNWETDGLHQVSSWLGKIYLQGGGQVFLSTSDGVNFTARWEGKWTVEGGTGLFRFAKSIPRKPLSVIAVNDPFVLPPSPGDVWTFDWVIVGVFKLF